MSSETSTNDQGLQPWQFFVLAALGCATAVTFIARGQGATPVVLLGLLMASAGFVGATVLRAVRPLVTPEDDRTAMIGQRTRAALEREKALALRSIKELEFDRAMGKVSESDWKEMSGRLRARTARLMRQLDAGSGFREQIEKDLERRLDDGRAKASPAGDGRRSERGDAPPKTATDRSCPQCSTSNDHDAKFCKGCGARL